jgi:hypothetical protein
MNLSGLPYRIDPMAMRNHRASNPQKVECITMYEVDVNDRVRELCQQILEEKDPRRVEELVKALRSTVRAGHEEARLRMSYVAKHYRSRLQALSSSSQGAERLNRGVGRIRGVLCFLGLGAGMRLGRETEG